jgi:hypothetical protein
MVDRQKTVELLRPPLKMSEEVNTNLVREGGGLNGRIQRGVRCSNDDITLLVHGTGASKFA